eukprot:2562716-Rhodomonas_salina.1
MKGEKKEEKRKTNRAQGSLTILPEGTRASAVGQVLRNENHRGTARTACCVSTEHGVAGA